MSAPVISLPVMLASTLGFSFKPPGVFDRNSALDVPPARPHCCPGPPE